MTAVQSGVDVGPPVALCRDFAWHWPRAPDVGPQCQAAPMPAPQGRQAVWSGVPTPCRSTSARLIRPRWCRQRNSISDCIHAHAPDRTKRSHPARRVLWARGICPLRHSRRDRTHGERSRRHRTCRAYRVDSSFSRTTQTCRIRRDQLWAWDRPFRLRLVTLDAVGRD